jgi:hypothetical protein
MRYEAWGAKRIKPMAFQYLSNAGSLRAASGQGLVPALDGVPCEADKAQPVFIGRFNQKLEG